MLVLLSVVATGPDMYLDGGSSTTERDEGGLARGVSCSACVLGFGELGEVLCPWVRRGRTGLLPAVIHVQPASAQEQGTSELDLNAVCNP